MTGAVQGNLVTLQAGLRYPHWGQVQTFAGRSVDERAEVGLLSRNIVIRGDSASAVATGFGGHIMVMAGAMAREGKPDAARASLHRRRPRPA